MSDSDAYDLFHEGQRRLRAGLTAQATVPLEKARKLEPAKASIREALGIAYFRLARWHDAIAARPAVQRATRKVEAMPTSRDHAEPDDVDRFFGRGRYARP